MTLGAGLGFLRDGELVALGVLQMFLFIFQIPAATSFVFHLIFIDSQSFSSSKPSKFCKVPKPQPVPSLRSLIVHLSATPSPTKVQASVLSIDDLDRSCAGDFERRHCIPGCRVPISDPA